MNDLNFNIYNILIFAGIFQGIIFSLITLSHKKFKSKTNNYIAFTVLALSLSNLQYWFMDVGFKGAFSIFKRFHLPFDVLIVPMFFLFVNNYIQNKINKKLVFLLSIPFVISLAFNLVYFRDLFFSKYTFRIINAILEISSLLFNLILIILIIYKIKLYDKLNINYDKKKIKVNTKWLKQLLYIGGVMCVFWLVEIMYVQSKNNIGLSKYYPLWITISILIYWISYLGIFQTRIYSEREFIRGSFFSEPISMNIPPKKTNKKLFNKISSWLLDSKIYLNPDLNLSMVATEFNISSGYLSQLFNSNGEVNFNEYINSLRVEEAKILLHKKEYNNYTILAIGLESGFNSKSSFYTAFNKFTEKTPNEYKKLVRNN